MMKVELEPGVWLADGEGDPGRTLREENAAEFKTRLDAAKALNKAREYRPFPKAVTTSFKSLPAEFCILPMRETTS
jgi:hypothetical protein